MISEIVSRLIVGELRKIVGKHGLTLEYAQMQTGLSKEAIRKALNNEVRKFRTKTAYKLADFIEEETNGKVVAEVLLKTKEIDFHGMDLRGTKSFAGQDLAGVDFSYADLRGADLRGCNLKMAKMARANLQDANLSGVSGWGADAIGANLSDTLLSNSFLTGWDFSGAIMRGASIRNTLIHHTCRFHGADLSYLKSVEGTEWNIIATNSRGMRLEGTDVTELRSSHAYQLTIF